MDGTILHALAPRRRPPGRGSRRRVLAIGIALTAVVAVLQSVISQSTQAEAASTTSQAPVGLAAASVAYPGLTTTPVLSGLIEPVNFEIDGSGRIFVALKSGLVKMYDGPGDTTAITVIDLRRDTYDHWDRGLLGLTLDPRFDTDRPYLYLLYSYDKDPFGSGVVPRWGTANGGDGCPTPPGATTDGCTSSGALVRYRITAAGTADPASAKVLLDGTTDPSGGWCHQFPSHSIGTVEFGADGALYVGAGDGANFNAVDYGQYGGSTATPANPCNDRPGVRGTPLSAANSLGGAVRSQAVRSASASGYVSWDGAILRVDPETGAALADNPLRSNGRAGDDRIVAYGLRNPFRFGFRPGTNQLWLGDVGWGTYEEINRFTTGPGQSSVPNFGWPCYEGNTRQGGYDGANIALCESLYVQGNQSLGGVSSPVTNPVYAWPRASGRPAVGCATSGGGSAIGGTFVTGDRWPGALKGAYVFGDFARNCIVAMRANAAGEPDPTALTTLVGGTSVVAIKEGPGGDLYFVDVGDGTIQRLGPPAVNQEPVASFTATPDRGAVPLVVALDASGSSDPEGGALTYTWDLDGDGACDDATGVRVEHAFTVSGSVTVKLCVRDASGAQSTATKVIRAGNLDPTVSVSVTSGSWKVGDTISFAAQANDAEDGVIAQSAYSWSFAVRHCADEQENSCHTHPVPGNPDGATATIEGPDHEYYAYIRATVTVTDSNGGIATATVDAKPRVSTVTLASDPAGVPGVSVGPVSGVAPRTAKFLENGVLQLIAPPNATVNGQSYRFTGWVDDAVAGATRNLRAPAGSKTYTATYAVIGTGPLISELTVSPVKLSVPRWSSKSVTIRARVRDVNGVAQVTGVLRSNSGAELTGTLSRISGTTTDGVYEGRVTVPGSSPSGTYASSVRARNAAGLTTVLTGPGVSLRTCWLGC